MINMQNVAKREMTNIDYLYLCSEIVKQIIKTNGRLDQFYIYGENSDKFVLRFRTKEGKKDIVFNPPEFLFLRQSEQIKTPAQSPFGSALKSTFSNYILRDVEQLQNDRIIRLKFENGQIVLEGMRNFNIIILDRNEVVINSYKKNDERIKIGDKYCPPKTEKKEINKENILEAMKDEEKIVVAITRNVALPAFYVNELLINEDIDPKSKTTEIKEENKQAIANRLYEFYKNLKLEIEQNLEELKNNKIQTDKEKKILPVLIEGKYLIADQKLIEKYKQKKESEIIVLSSLSEIQEKIYRIREMQEIKKENEKRINKLLDRLKHQEEREKELIQEINKEKEKGNWIMQNAHYVDEIIRKYKEIKMKGGKEELEKFLKENNLELTKDGIKIKIEKKE